MLRWRSRGQASQARAVGARAGELKHGVARVTVRDVAEKAGVSISTVSRVLTGSAPVSRELHRRVVAAIEELGYRPNALARGLRSRRTAVLGLIVPDIANPFFSQLARVIEQQAHHYGYSILLCNSENSRERELQYFSLLTSQRVDGMMLISSAATHEQLDEFQSRTDAVVLALDRRIPGFRGPYLGADAYPGAYEAIGHLLALSHRRIGIVRGVEGNLSSDERFEAILRAYKDHGLVEEPWIFAGPYSVETGIKAGAALAQLPREARPTAVIAASEFTAYGLIQSLHDHGLSVPGDVSVVGYDNTAFAELFRPGLTAVAQPIERMGERAVELVLEMIESAAELPPPPVAPLPGTMRLRTHKAARVPDETLPTRLVVRESSGPAPGQVGALRLA